MAAGDFVVSAKRKLREGDVGANRPVSEGVTSAIAGSVNSLIDSSFYVVEANWVGYVGATRLFNQAPIRIENDSDIIQYSFSVHYSGNTGANFNVVNFNVYDDTGSFVNTLFGAGADRCLISGAPGTDVLVGRDLDNSQTFQTNTAGHTIQFGNLNITTLQAGYILRPFIQTAAPGARGMRFSMRLREQ